MVPDHSCLDDGKTLSVSRTHPLERSGHLYVSVYGCTLTSDQGPSPSRALAGLGPGFVPVTFLSFASFETTMVSDPCPERQGRDRTRTRVLVKRAYTLWT